MSIYNKGEKKAIEKEAMKWEGLGLVVLVKYNDGTQVKGKAWLLYNFDIKGTGYVLTGDVKLPASLISEMKVIASEAFAKVAPMAMWTKDWRTINGIDGASSSECYGHLLRKYASNEDEYKPRHTNVSLYGMTDQASGISPLNANLRKERMKWVDETWFTEGKPKDVVVRYEHHNATNSASKSYFQRGYYNGKIAPLTKKKGRAQHRSVMILKIPPPAVTKNRQLELAKKYHREIVNAAIKAMKHPHSDKGKLILCLLNKIATETIDFRYLTPHGVNEYIKVAHTDHERSTSTKKTYMEPDDTKRYNKKSGRVDIPLRHMSNMLVDVYKAIRCAEDIPDFIDRCGKLIDGMLDGWAAAGDLTKDKGTAAGEPELMLQKWMARKMDNDASINSCHKVMDEQYIL